MVFKNEIKLKKERGVRIRGCGVSGCCPVVEFTGKDVFIKDDYGNRVRLSREQWQYLVKKAR
jgi:hypothetical protein